MTLEFIPTEFIESKIYVFRGKKVMVDRELARLYDVETRVLNQAVRRNIKRFPEDFMFQLTDQELEILRSHTVTSSSDHGGRRYLPYVFTEQGVAMLSSVLTSDRAIMVNIQIMRTFTKMRAMFSESKELRYKLELLEKEHDEKFIMIFDAIRRLINTSSEEEKEIGFKY